MKKVITYGTYDLFHFGHQRLLERAKALGDYLIVGVTADDFDKARGKINVQQSLMERMEAVRATGLADEIIVEEYEGQKIDDVLRFGIDIFAIGSDWQGKFDYLSEYCKVVYLERTGASFRRRSWSAFGQDACRNSSFKDDKLLHREHRKMPASTKQRSITRRKQRLHKLSGSTNSSSKTKDDSLCRKDCSTQSF